MRKKLLISIVAVLLIAVNLSGCNESSQNNNTNNTNNTNNSSASPDVKTLLVNQISWISTRQTGDMENPIEHHTYIFYDNDTYQYEIDFKDKDGNFDYCKSNGSYHITNGKIYFDQRKNQTSDDGVSWIDSELHSYEYSIEIINSSLIMIGSDKFT